MKKAQQSESPCRRYEKNLQETASQFLHDPSGFVRWAFDWGQGDLRDHEGPDHWQDAFLQNLGQALSEGRSPIQMAVSSGHGVGKGALASWLILWAMSTRPHLSAVITANTARQLESKTWRELALWQGRAVNGHWFHWSPSRFVYREHPSTWGVTPLAWNEHNAEAFAGLHAEHVLVIFDEASAIPDAIWEVCDGAMTTGGAIWAVFGNPTRNSGRFRDCFGKNARRWQGRKVDSRNCRMTNKKLLSDWVCDHGEDSDFVKVRIRGEFPNAAVNQFIPVDLLAVQTVVSPDQENTAPLVFGVDVARFGQDDSVILARQGRCVLWLERFSGLDTMQLAEEIAAKINETNPDTVFVDGVGVGGGVVDRLRQLGHRVLDVNVGQRASRPEVFVNKRAEIWSRLRDWLREGGILPPDPQLREELISPSYGFDAANRLQIERKDSLRARGLPSPDAADALALTFAQPVAARKGLAGRPNGLAARTDFDLFT